MENHHVQFFTATILKWIPILKNDELKQIIVNSMAFLVEDKRCDIYGFVIMPNHIHMIWKIGDGHLLSNVQRDFLKFTSQQIRFYLRDNFPESLTKFEVNLKDRKYQIWQRNALSVDLFSRKVIEQKLDYIHANLVAGKWQLAEDFVSYKYSSASFYEDGKSHFTFLKHYMEYFGA
ncbi:transposase IS200 family protein [Roseivirga ehrenbergii]|uniref:Transposase n=1 Tax=Roseivirga ehrenbergii (strain DSM 102268 / JCM 13514 / KCTC 12282 / NCIMB 14502 / KMM 6017) TaxID=279360 RepID=A0A150XR71_ROSEK|nr:transposase [Roseivirga ehrenbergii]KYG81082.1 transposase [Roseivirga ehrenbergii]TCL00955.1 transposase IS200 family protein [Roseivirga ehrenbergii]